MEDGRYTKPPLRGELRAQTTPNPSFEPTAFGDGSIPTLGGYVAMGIDVKVESPYGSDGETLGDPQAFVSLLLVAARVDETKCLQFIDAYGDTVFNQLQIPVLIDEFRAAMSQISAESLMLYREMALKRARGANLDAAIIGQYEKEARASEFERRSEVSKVKSHAEKVLRVLQDAVNAGPHHYVRFMGD